jgi:hypothetical protein
VSLESLHWKANPSILAFRRLYEQLVQTFDRSISFAYGLHMEICKIPNAKHVTWSNRGASCKTTCDTNEAPARRAMRRDAAIEFYFRAAVFYTVVPMK